MITPQNTAGIAAVYAMSDAASGVYMLLHGLLHRGSDGAGIASANGERVSLFKRQGMLSEVFNEQRLKDLDGNMALGQVRMASSSDIAQENLQPVMVRAHQGSFAVASTGMVLNAPSLRRSMEEDGLIFQGTGDAEIIAHLIQVSEGKMVEKIESAAHILKGPYTFILMTKNTMYAVVSRQAVASLYYAKCGEGILFASETSAFGMFETDAPVEIQPGSMVILGKEGFSVRQMEFGVRHRCALEPVYYSREDSQFDSRSVHKIRQALGTALAKGETAQADLVIGVPDTATSAAAAFAQALHLPYELGLIKNRYFGSTFVRSAREQREEGIKVRLNAISSIVKDKSVLVVDDSIQKGATARYICRMLKEAGAKEVHFRVASIQIAASCLYGTEYIAQDDLASYQYEQSELQEILGADSLRFLDAESFEEVLGPHVCMACLNGEQPYDPLDYASLNHPIQKKH